MFVNAIQLAADWTRPIHTIARYFGSDQVHPGTATLFFVNDEGWALTGKHVAQTFIVGEQMRTQRTEFDSERAKLDGNRKRQAERALERKFGFERGKLFELQHRMINCIEGPLELSIKMHPSLDVALLKFSGFTALNPKVFPNFAANGSDLKQGKSLCRLGFPFPEFSNFAFNSQTDSIEWTDQGRNRSPQFPIDGMVTRHLGGPAGETIGFELSTPGIRGQSGGPAFDIRGNVWGMQTATNHLDLNFDVDLEVYRNGIKRHVKESAVLHVGHCVHVDVLKDFMRQNDVSFSEEVS